MNRSIKARVIGLDNSDVTYWFEHEEGRWSAINEYYGKLIQDGVIKTAFIELVG